jgi:hypothetical protein
MLAVLETWSGPHTICHAIGQVVSHQIPTAVAWVQSQVKSRGICGGKSGTGASFL